MKFLLLKSNLHLVPMMLKRILLLTASLTLEVPHKIELRLKVFPKTTTFSHSTKNLISLRTNQSRSNRLWSTMLMISLTSLSLMPQILKGVYQPPTHLHLSLLMSSLDRINSLPMQHSWITHKYQPNNSLQWTLSFNNNTWQGTCNLNSLDNYLRVSMPLVSFLMSILHESKVVTACLLINTRVTTSNKWPNRMFLLLTNMALTTCNSTKPR